MLPGEGQQAHILLLRLAVRLEQLNLGPAGRPRSSALLRLLDFRLSLVCWGIGSALRWKVFATLTLADRAGIFGTSAGRAGGSVRGASTGGRQGCRQDKIHETMTAAITV